MNSDLKPLFDAFERAFFLSDDGRLLESQRELHTLDITSGLWAEVSGIRHPRVLALWERWQVPTAIVAALTVVPLAVAVWADQTVEHEERREVLDSLKDTFFFGTIVQDLINAWLDRKPDDAVFEAWATLIRELSRKADGADRALLAEEILWAARSLSHRGAEEKAAFDRLARAFHP
jgi:hypothetical protein